LPLKGLNSRLQPLNPALLTRFGFPKFPDLLGSSGRLIFPAISTASHAGHLLHGNSNPLLNGLAMHFH
jgi:hypothetical protein